MAKAWNFFLLRQHGFHMFHRIGFRLVDRLKNVEYSFVRASVQRSLQSSDGGGDRRMHIG